MFWSPPGFSVLHYLPEFAEIHVHWVDDTIQSSHPLSPPSPPAQSFPASGSFPMSQLFTLGGQSIWASPSASVLPEYQRLTSFRIDPFDLLAIQGTLKSFLQHHNLKASVLQLSVFFFIVQLSHPYMITGKNHRFDYMDFGEVMSSPFNTLSEPVITFNPRSKHLLSSWLQSLFTVILEPKKIKSVTVSICFLIYLPWSDGTGCHDLSFL